MSWVYLLECSDGTLYCGATTDLEARLKAHNQGKGARYTRNRLPVKLVWSKECVSYPNALSEEYRIKRLSRKEKLSLIQNN